MLISRSIKGCGSQHQSITSCFQLRLSLDDVRNFCHDSNGASHVLCFDVTGGPPQRDRHRWLADTSNHDSAFSLWYGIVFASFNISPLVCQCKEVFYSQILPGEQ
jgi:hypothetical protein